MSLAGSPAAGVHGSAGDPSWPRGCVYITQLFLKADLLRSRTEVPLAFSSALLDIIPISPDFTSAVTI